MKRIKHTEKLSKNLEMSIDNLGNEQLWYVRGSGEKLKIPQPSKRDELISRAHLLGHFQAESTLKRLQSDYYCRRMAEDVKKVVEECEVCRLYEKQASVQHPARAIKTLNVHCMIGMDLVLGFPESQEGHVGLLVITEYMTKYPYVKAIKNKSAKEIAPLLWEYITLFGPPKVILSDNGTEFVNSVVDSMLRMVGTEHRVTSAYHPRTNGQTERMNATLVGALRKHAMQDRASWHQWIPYVLMAYRTRIHSVTKYTPFELMFGRQMITFENWSNAEVFTEEDIAAAVRNRSCEIRKMVDTTHAQSIEHVDEAKEKQVIKQNKAQKTSSENLKVGSQVYVTTVGLHDKLWEGKRSFHNY